MRVIAVCNYLRTFAIEKQIVKAKPNDSILIKWQRQ